MAKKEILVSDLSGSTEGVETVSFTYGDRSYELELTTAEASTLDSVLRPYIEVSRSEKIRSTRSPSSPSGTSAKVVRSWAQSHGFEVSARGKLPEAVREAYKSAHSQ